MTTWSTPLAWRAALFLMYPGRWEAWQTGVKAPGRATMTIFLSANSGPRQPEGVAGTDERRGGRHEPLLASYFWGMPHDLMSLSGATGM